MENVSQRKAPGAMSAMAFIVKPVRPNVACISAVFFSAVYDCLHLRGLTANSSISARGEENTLVAILKYNATFRYNESSFWIGWHEKMSGLSAFFGVLPVRKA
jgi:hypothetical protein